LLLVSFSSSLAETIRGHVTDQRTGAPLPFASVKVNGTTLGARADETGEFRIDGLSPGTYVLSASFVGYEGASSLPVEVLAAAEARVDVALVETSVRLIEVLVEAQKTPAIDLKKTQSIATINSSDFQNLPIDEPDELFDLLPGVVARAGEIHVGGSRDGEVGSYLNGIPADNPAGSGGLTLGNVAIDEVEIILGGMDAKYGQAQAGVINYTTREGGEHVEGQIRYETDDFGAPDKTFNDFDRVQLGIGGPLPIANATYFLSAQGTWQNTFPATRERRNHDRVLDFISVGDRGINDVRLQGKISWKPAIPYKLTLEVLDNHTRRDDYIHNWSWDGYVQTFLDTVRTGDGSGDLVVRRHGPWSPVKVDDSYEYYNAFEHTPDTEHEYSNVALGFSHTTGEKSFYTVRLSRQAFEDRVSVQGKNPWEYEGETVPDYYFDFLNDEQSPFFVRFGDFPDWSIRRTKVYQSRVDITHRWRKHTIEAGSDFRYNDLFFHRVQDTFLSSGNGDIGLRDRYHYYQPEGAAYVQDRWEHEGMVLNVGLRFDAFSVGGQVDPSEVTSRVTRQLSPRIGIAYPITDRDVFNFHYGRFYQFPDRQLLFNNRRVSDNRIRGNPNLTNETTVCYRAAIQHLFSSTVRGQFSVYYKDIFGQLAVEKQRAETAANLVEQFVNRDYASARGFEVSFTRQFAGGFAGELGYSYGVATGVASDPNAENELNFRYLPISEQPLDWDQRHVVDLSFSLRDPSDAWGLGVVWSVGTGFPYTPNARDTRDIEPEVVNSRRLPNDTSLDIQAERHYEVWGRPLNLFVQARNLLDTRTIVDLDPALIPLPPGFDGNEYVVYYSETGNAGGAHLGEDIDGDGDEDWVPVHDPRVFGEGRAMRMGVSVVF
jgi:hypothetical protein